MLSSPFPGMDPYLEEPAGWPDVHHSLLSSIREHIAAEVSPNFYVRVEERVYLTNPVEDSGYEMFIPDVILTRTHPFRTQQMPLTAVATITEPVLIEEMVDEEIHDYYLEVRDARAHEVVTAIELLSPANKVQGSRGYEALREKRGQLRLAGAHWIEIDLLRGGYRPVGLAGKSDYCVTLFRHGYVRRVAWFIDLRDPLPTIAVPLRPPFDDVPLNLQQVLTDTYHRAYYGDSLDYTQPIPPPKLQPADEAWVKNLLTAWLARS